MQQQCLIRCQAECRFCASGGVPPIVDLRIWSAPVLGPNEICYTRFTTRLKILGSVLRSVNAQTGVDERKTLGRWCGH